MSDAVTLSSEIDRWERIDRWFEKMGDRFNPILVKETRQALKSRQFVVTFSILLFAAFAWTVAGSLSMMPQIYTTPSAPRLLIGYYFVLAIPMLLVVPLAAYRSLEGEIDDGTLELLSITALSPWQIVLGKLASATLQMMLYFVALFPCVAYAYNLRGVDLPTVLLMIGILLVTALVLTVIALFLAPLSRGRTGRIVTLLLLILVLVLAEYGIGALVISMILYGTMMSVSLLFFLVATAIVVSLSLSHLLLSATAAQLTPESENRSTTLRLSMMVFSASLAGIVVYATQALNRSDTNGVLWFAFIAAFGLWLAAGSMMAAESSVITPRIRRELPQSFLARMMLTWFTPGPATGIVFASVNLVVWAGFAALVLGSIFNWQSPASSAGFREPLRMLVLLVAYAIGGLICVRLVILVVRINNHPRVEIGLAALVAVMVLSALVPYSIGMHLNDYRNFPYSRWQLTNWVWTINEAQNGIAVGWIEVIMILSVVGLAFLICLLTMPQVVMPRRTATPEEVIEALRQK